MADIVIGGRIFTASQMNDMVTSAKKSIYKYPVCFYREAEGYLSKESDIKKLVSELAKLSGRRSYLKTHSKTYLEAKAVNVVKGSKDTVGSIKIPVQLELNLRFN